MVRAQGTSNTEQVVVGWAAWSADVVRNPDDAQHEEAELGLWLFLELPVLHKLGRGLSHRHTHCTRAGGPMPLRAKRVMLTVKRLTAMFANCPRELLWRSFLTAGSQLS